MKAVRMYGIKDLRIEEVKKPTPAADEVLLKIHAVGICGSDIPRVNKKGPHVLPLTLGHEFAGEVVEVGSAVSEFVITDRVTVAPLIPDYNDPWSKKGIFSLSEGYQYYGSRNDGAFAEYLAVKASNCLKLSVDLPYEWAATVDPAANAVHTFLIADAKPEDSIAIFGLGAIGMFAVQYAKALGMKNIIAIDIDDHKLDIAKLSGATTVINSRISNVTEEVLKVTNQQGVNVALEMSGAPVAQLQGLEVVGKMGRVVYLGISNSSLEIPAPLLDKILRYQLSLKGSWNSFSAPFPGFEWTESVRLMEEGKLNPELLITQRLALDAVPETFNKIDRHELDFIKVMFYPHGIEKI